MRKPRVFLANRKTGDVAAVDVKSAGEDGSAIVVEVGMTMARDIPADSQMLKLFNDYDEAAAWCEVLP